MWSRRERDERGEKWAGQGNLSYYGRVMGRGRGGVKKEVGVVNSVF